MACVRLIFDLMFDLCSDLLTFIRSVRDPFVWPTISSRVNVRLHVLAISGMKIYVSSVAVPTQHTLPAGELYDVSINGQQKLEGAFG